MGHDLKDISGKNFAVLGLGVSGCAVARFLNARGAEVYAVDDQANETTLSRLQALEQVGITGAVGRYDQERLQSAEWVVVSPGVMPSNPTFTVLRERIGERLISEIELAAWFLECPVIAITGTNGKTTTVTVLEGFLNGVGKHAIAAGNIGTPVVDVIERLKPDSLLVLEVSSFQLETTRTFRPHIAAILNITPDHLNWHGSMPAYAAAKAKLFKNQTESDHAFLNARDDYSAALASGVQARVAFFNETGTLNANWDLVFHIAKVLGFRSEQVQTYLDGFKGVAHRMQAVPSGISELCFINDSKSTNPASLEWALEQMEQPVLLICGGRNKGNDFGVLKPLIQKKTKACFLIGESAEAMRQAWPEANCCLAGELDAALEAAVKAARSGDTVLFSPGCASFDQFSNYIERGETFRDLVTRRWADTARRQCDESNA